MRVEAWNRGTWSRSNCDLCMMQNSTVVARLDFRECPEGILFRPSEPDQRIERTLFAAWHNAATHAPHLGSWRQFCVITEDFSDRKVLENTNKHVGCLLAGDEYWR